jgi:hypothetical protein
MKQPPAAEVDRLEPEAEVEAPQALRPGKNVFNYVVTYNSNCK